MVGVGCGGGGDGGHGERGDEVSGGRSRVVGVGCRERWGGWRTWGERGWDRGKH